ncbi:MAG: hypothetical protein P4L96_17170 [Rhodoferax sp.]|nr:hypothetical protein [Rhodoferax sp.]
MKAEKMFRTILTTALALTLISASLFGLSQLAAAVLGRPFSVAELVLTAVVLVAAILAVLRHRKRHTQRKYRDLQDSALW